MSVYNQQVTIRQQHQQRLNELLDAVKQEFEFTLNEASNFKQVKDEYDLKYNQQISEMQQIRQTVYELEMAHRKIKEAYEEEILRLKTELENRLKSNLTQQQQQVQQQQQQVQQQVQQQQQPVQIQQPVQPPQIQQPVQQQQQTIIPPPNQSGGNNSAPINPSIPPINNNLGINNGSALPSTNTPSTPNAAGTAAANNNSATPTAATNALVPSNPHLQVIDPTQYIVNPNQKSLHIKEIPPFLSDLDISKAHPDFKKQLQDYYVLYNPAFARNLDVELIHSLNHSSVVCCVRFSKNGEFIATGCNKTTQVFNVKTGELVAKLIDDNNSNGINDDSNKEKDTNSNGDLYIRSACFSPDGKFLATGAEDKLIRIWDLTTKRIIKILRGHEQDIYSLDFFPDGNRLVSGSGDRTVRTWDLRSSQCSLTLSIEDGVTTVAVSPDGSLIAAGSLDRTVRVWDSTTGFLVERLDSGNEQGNGHEDSVYSVAFSTNGKQISSGSLDRTVKLWNLQGKSDSTINLKKSSCDVTYIGHKDFVLSVCSTPNNEYVLSGSKDRGIIFWDRESGNPLLMLQGHRNSVISVAVSLDSNETEGIFASGSGDCKARIWKWSLKK